MNEAVKTIDLHGKNTYQAKTAVDAALKNSGYAYRIRIIHGFNSGTALKEMILREYSAHPKVIRVDTSPGPGVTDLVLREI